MCCRLATDGRHSILFHDQKKFGLRVRVGRGFLCKRIGLGWDNPLTSWVGLTHGSELVGLAGSGLGQQYIFFQGKIVKCKIGLPFPIIFLQKLGEKNPVMKLRIYFLPIWKK